MPLYGAIEAGGTKFLCGVGTSPENLEVAQFPTTTPGETMPAVIGWLKNHSPEGLTAIGIGSFGPVDIDTGTITNTPKLAWQHFPLAASIREAFPIPIRFNSDVNAALLGEVRWGAAHGIANCIYLTIGTGIGGSAISSGLLLHGVSHPEMGHVRIPHDLARDPFAGCCPFHSDCLEGLASGPAMAARWGENAKTLPPDHPAWALEAEYLAQAIATLACTLSPQRVLLGGGVMQQERLFEPIRHRTRMLLADYVLNPEILPPGLGQRAGLLGALALAIFGISMP